ncbi:MAG: hypothetical protein WC277_12380 [Bacilli bacterium]
MINRPPKGGLVPPLSGGIANTAPAPSGAGEEAEGRAESGGMGVPYLPHALDRIYSMLKGTKRRKAARIENNFIILSVLIINMIFGALLWPLEKVK